MKKASTAIIFDTNVLVSFLLSNFGSISELEKEWKAGNYTALYSVETLAELTETLKSRKLQKIIDQERKYLLLDLLQVEGLLISVTASVLLCRDPKDNAFLNLALSGKAKFLITGDKDLLDITEDLPFRILTPAQFLTRHSKQEA